MFVLLFLVSQVAGEWVEIAQNHYRKEPAWRVTVAYEEISSGNRIYANQSITERSWIGGAVTRIPNVGKVKRVRLTSKTEDEFTIGIIHENMFTTEKMNINGKYENGGSVNEPNFKNTKFAETEAKRKNNDDDNRRDGYNEEDEKSNIHAPSRYLIRRTQVTSNKTPNIFIQNRKENIKENNFQGIKRFDIRNHEIIDIDKDFSVQIDPNIKLVPNISDNQQIANESNVNLKKNVMIGDSKNDIHDKLEDKNVQKDYEIPANTKIYKAEILSPQGPLTMSRNVENAENERRDKSDQNKNPIIDHNDNEINRPNFNKVLEKQQTINENDKLANGPKNNTIEVLWKFMKIITNNISRNTQRSFKGKMRYLEVLRNNILLNIEEHIERAWSDDAQRRRKRTPRGHVEFPSSESALMTISFLTFAVFLIKLVLQVIHTYKNKTMMVTPAVVAAVGRATAALREQKSN